MDIRKTRDIAFFMFLLILIQSPAIAAEPDLNIGQVKENNGIYINYNWISDSHNESEINDLLDELSQHDIRYLFVHVGFLWYDGNIEYARYNYNFTNIVSNYNANNDYDFVVLAWINGKTQEQVFDNKSNPTDLGLTDISNYAVRDNIVNVCHTFINTYNYDGCHLNLENNIDNGDQNFLKLLDSIKNNIGSNKILSVVECKLSNEIQ